MTLLLLLYNILYIYNGNTELTRLLLDSGADITCFEDDPADPAEEKTLTRAFFEIILELFK